ncbi:hypothetical protein [Nocardia sp. NPDC004711]
MAFILALTLTSLALFVGAIVGRIVQGSQRDTSQLTVDKIRARLAAEGARTYVPVSRGW